MKIRIAKVEKNLGFKTSYKVVEDGGTSLTAKLVRKDPSPEPCGRRSCLPCQDKPGMCTRPGLVYRFTCRTCLAQGKSEKEAGVYIGETARTAFDRGAEHDAERRTQNHLW